jgi:hypothetical protein
MAAAPIPDASTQTRDNERFMEFKNSFGFLVAWPALLALKKNLFFELTRAGPSVEISPENAKRRTEKNSQELGKL